jgi:hypothetical protein
MACMRACMQLVHACNRSSQVPPAPSGTYLDIARACAVSHGPAPVLHSLQDELSQLPARARECKILPAALALSPPQALFNPP